MDAKVLLTIAIILLVFWAVRNHIFLDSQSSNRATTQKRINRRSSDRWLLSREFQRFNSESETNNTTKCGDAVAADRPENVIAAAGVACRAASLPASSRASLQADIDRLTDQLHQRDHALMRNQHAMEDVVKLNKKMFEKGRELEMLKQACARSDAALAHYRTKAQRTAMMEQQLSESRKKSADQEVELQSLRTKLAAELPDVIGPEASPGKDLRAFTVADKKLRNIQQKKQNLSSVIRSARKEAAEAQQNDLELRRLRSELASVRADHSNAQNRISELKIRVSEQQKALEKARETSKLSGEVSALKQSQVDRQLQNEVLMLQLSRLSESFEIISAGNVTEQHKSSSNDDERQE